MLKHRRTLRSLLSRMTPLKLLNFNENKINPFDFFNHIFNLFTLYIFISKNLRNQNIQIFVQSISRGVETCKYYLPVCILICICCELLDPNVLPHSRHGNCRPDTLLWLCLWFINDLPSGNSSPHTSQVTTLFRCDNMCLFNLALLWKVFAHLLHP